VSSALRIAAFWSATWLVLGAFWLLLVDTLELAELLTGAVVVTIGATGSELVRANRVARVRFRMRWLLRAYRPALMVPRDLLVLAAEIVRALTGRRHPADGGLRAMRFDGGGNDPLDNGRRALVEWLGSLSPNAFVVGIDVERDLIVVHQLRRRGDPAQVMDPLDLR
jgi:multisubunit Na+/H+ antiporter MnhE subunit